MREPYNQPRDYNANIISSVTHHMNKHSQNAEIITFFSLLDSVVSMVRMQNVGLYLTISKLLFQDAERGNRPRGSHSPFVLEMHYYPHGHALYKDAN